MSTDSIIKIRNIPLSTRLSTIINIPGFGVMVIISIMFIVMTTLSDKFLSYYNLFNILRQIVPISIISIGMTFVIISGGIDFSVGSLVALAGGTTAYLLGNDINIVIAILGGVVMGFGVGLINGLLITRVGLSDLIATLAMMSVARGMIYVWTAGIPFRNYMTPAFKFLGGGRIGGVPFPVIVLAVLAICFIFILRKTRFGSYVYAIGSNIETSKLVGINFRNIKTYTYCLTGCCAAVAGIINASRLTTVHPEWGIGYEMEVIAAVVIGGTRLTGGRGTIYGSLLGAFLVGLVRNAITLLDLEPMFYKSAVGIIILLAIVIDRLGKKN
jgi:ribose transport system permease protein